MLARPGVGGFSDSGSNKDDTKLDDDDDEGTIGSDISFQLVGSFFTAENGTEALILAAFDCGLSIVAIKLAALTLAFWRLSAFLC